MCKFHGIYYMLVFLKLKIGIWKHILIYIRHNYPLSLSGIYWASFPRLISRSGGCHLSPLCWLNWCTNLLWYLDWQLHPAYRQKVRKCGDDTFFVPTCCCVFHIYIYIKHFHFMTIRLLHPVQQDSIVPFLQITHKIQMSEYEVSFQNLVYVLIFCLLCYIQYHITISYWKDKYKINPL